MSLTQLPHDSDLSYKQSGRAAHWLESNLSEVVQIKLVCAEENRPIVQSWTILCVKYNVHLKLQRWADFSFCPFMAWGMLQILHQGFNPARAAPERNYSQTSNLSWYLNAQGTNIDFLSFKGYVAKFLKRHCCTSWRWAGECWWQGEKVPRASVF